MAERILLIFRRAHESKKDDTRQDDTHPQSDGLYENQSVSSESQVLNAIAQLQRKLPREALQDGQSRLGLYLDNLSSYAETIILERPVETTQETEVSLPLSSARDEPEATQSRSRQRPNNSTSVIPKEPSDKEKTPLRLTTHQREPPETSTNTLHARLRSQYSDSMISYDTFSGPMNSQNPTILRHNPNGPSTSGLDQTDRFAPSVDSRTFIVGHVLPTRGKGPKDTTTISQKVFEDAQLNENLMSAAYQWKPTEKEQRKDKWILETLTTARKRCPSHLFKVALDDTAQYGHLMLAVYELFKAYSWTVKWNERSYIPKNTSRQPLILNLWTINPPPVSEDREELRQWFIDTFQKATTRIRHVVWWGPIGDFDLYFDSLTALHSLTIAYEYASLEFQRRKAAA